jgi:putative hydrolase of the HAD superfamily
MIIKVDRNTCIVFDLDDTLYSEIDYLKSAFSYIAAEIAPESVKLVYDEMINTYISGGDTFKFITEKYSEKNLTIEKLLYLYRNHYPKISLREGVLEMLIAIKKRNGRTGIITDGRSITQRNKIKALGLEEYFDKIVISEEFGSQKPADSLFESFVENGIEAQYYYIGDNIYKDFISPKKLKWCCIGVLDKNNIHSQNLSDFSIDLLPHLFINRFNEIEII